MREGETEREREEGFGEGRRKQLTVILLRISVICCEKHNTSNNRIMVADSTSFGVFFLFPLSRLYACTGNH